MALDWQQIPSDLIDLEKTAQDANDWAAQQRAQLAARWAAMQKQVLSTIQDQWQQDAQAVAGPVQSLLQKNQEPGYQQTLNPSLALPGPSDALTPAEQQQRQAEDTTRQTAAQGGAYLPPPPGQGFDLKTEIPLAVQAESSRTRPFFLPGPTGLTPTLTNPNIVPQSGEAGEEIAHLGNQLLGGLTTGVKDIGQFGSEIASGLAGASGLAENARNALNALHSPAEAAPAAAIAQIAQRVGRPAAGAVLGAGINAAQNNPNETPEEKAKRIALGALYGGAGGYALQKGIPPGLTTRLTDEGGPFYSQAERLIQEKMPERATGGQVLATLLNNGAKQAELDWTGLKDYLTQNKDTALSKQDVQNFIQQNQVQVQEVTKGAPILPPQIVQRGQQIQARLAQAEQSVNDLIDRLHPNTPPEQRSQVIDQMRANPQALPPEAQSALQDLDKAQNAQKAFDTINSQVLQSAEPTQYEKWTTPGGNNYRELLLTMPNADGDTFQSNHWEEPNILAHVRFDERMAPNGEKTLFIQEIQSDWAQKGRAGQVNIPPTPFANTTDWTKLALKRMVAWAAENGFDRIAWTTGKQQADRYNLAQYVDRLQLTPLSDGKSILQGWRNGTSVMNAQVDAQQLADYVGKDVAKTLLEKGEAAGSDLQIGGHGMQAYYDKIVPSVAADLGKKYGAKIENTTIQAGPQGEQTVHSMTVPPALKDAALKGQQLFAVGPVAASTVPQQPGEGDEAYQRRVAAERALSLVGFAGSLHSNDAATQKFLDMFAQEAPKASYLDEAGIAQRLATNFARAWTDNGIDLVHLENQVEKDTGTKLDPSERMSMLRLLNPNSAAELNLRQNLSPLLHAVGDKLDYLNTYLAAKHNIDIADAKGNPDRAFPGGVTAADSKQVIDNFQQNTGLSNQEFATIKQAAQGVVDFNKNLLQKLVDGGLVDPALAKDLKDLYPNYVPTKIVDYLVDPTDLPTGKKLSITATGLKRLTDEGTERAALSPVEATIMNAYRTEAAVVRNKTFNAIVDLRQKDPSLQKIFVQVNKPGTAIPTNAITPTREIVPVSGFIDGQHVAYAMPRDLAEAIQATSSSILPALQSVMAVERGLLASNNPLFVGTHAAITFVPAMLRLIATEGGTPAALGRVAVAMAQSYAEILGDIASGRIVKGRYSPTIEKYITGGGMMFGGQAPQSIQETKAALADLQRVHALEINSISDYRNILRILGDVATGKPIAELINRIDMAPRAAAYRLAQARNATETAAVTAGRRASTDFRMGGNYSRQLNQIIPFTNVAIQSAMQALRTTRENPKQMALTALSLLAAPTVAAEAWNRATPDRAKKWDDVPNYYKDRGLALMTDWTIRDANGNVRPLIITVPLRIYSPFVSLTREIAGRAMGAEPRAWNDLLGGMLGEANPFHGLPFGIAAETGIGLAYGINPQTGGHVASQIGDVNAGTVAKGIARGANTVANAAGLYPDVRPSQVQFVEDELGGPGRVVGSIGRPQGEGQPLNPFLRYASGQGLTNARNAAVSPQLRQVMNAAGIKTLGPASNEIQNMTLTTQEEEQYQTLLNQQLDRYAGLLLQDPRYGQLDAATKKTITNKLIANVRKQAAAQILATIIRQDGAPAVAKRIQETKARKAS